MGRGRVKVDPLTPTLFRDSLFWLPVIAIVGLVAAAGASVSIDTGEPIALGFVMGAGLGLVPGFLAGALLHAVRRWFGVRRARAAIIATEKTRSQS
jgi:hypothetical protein